MKIIRFIDQNDTHCYGHDFQSGSAVLLEGELNLAADRPLGGLVESSKRVVVEKILAPLVPAAILCIGLNYRQHAEEFGSALPEHPVLFMKNPAALNHPDDPIVLPKSCLSPPQVDYEVELAVVIGKAAKNVAVENALDHVFGYTIGNDVSARRWQKHSGGGQWIRGKSFDGFCPLGPALVTADQISDPQCLGLQSKLNGQVMQKANTSDMIFSVAELIHYLSDGTTLLPGTVIMTGTPSGVGFARQPPVFLKKGDSLEMSIDGIGDLENFIEEEN